MRISNPLIPSSQSYLYGKIEHPIEEDFHMSDKTKKIVRFVATGVTIAGIVGLFVSGGTEADVSNAVKIGTMIAAILGSIVTNVVKK